MDLVAKALLCKLLPPALHYEVLLKESRQTSEPGSPHHGKITAVPSQERIETCFQVFGKPHDLLIIFYLPQTHEHTAYMFATDDLIVHLGVYQRVMKIIREELYGRSCDVHAQ